MIAFGGWKFPDGESHLVEHMGKNLHEVDGRYTYQYHKLELALGYVKTCGVAVDVGAHVGLMSYFMAKFFRRVEAFEPMPAHVACFRENVTASNVALHECALGAAAGEAMMVVHTGNSGHSHLQDRVSAGSVPVEVRTLDSFGFPEVAFIKIDVEGTELDVLRGAVKTLTRCRPVLMVEQKPGNGRRYGYGDLAALKFLTGLGMRQVAQKAGDFILV